jgi:integrin-linked kinase-associated serine/threonine phosphatase 2C
MSSAEACGFVLRHEGRDTVSDALVAECRARWDEMNKSKKSTSKIGDIPYLKFGCDDITAVVAYLTFIEEVDQNEQH